MFGTRIKVDVVWWRNLEKTWFDPTFWGWVNLIFLKKPWMIRIFFLEEIDFGDWNRNVFSIFFRCWHLCQPRLADSLKHKASISKNARWWFQILFGFIPFWGRFPIWLIFSNGLKPPTWMVEFPFFSLVFRVDSTDSNLTCSLNYFSNLWGCHWQKFGWFIVSPWHYFPWFFVSQWFQAHFLGPGLTFFLWCCLVYSGLWPDILCEQIWPRFDLFEQGSFN